MSTTQAGRPSAERGVVGRSAVARTRPPRPRSNDLERASLVQRLVGADGVVSVVAPAGFGKTTVVVQWLQAEPRPAAWLTLDDADNDPAVLVAHLHRALAAAIDVAATGRSPLDRYGGLDAIRSALAAGPIVLVVDDVQHLTAPGGVEVLGHLLDDLGAGVAAAVVGRTVPDRLRLARRVLATGGTMLGSEDLRLDATEAASLVRTRRSDLGDEAVRLIVERADGWAALLGLAATVIQPSMGPEELRAALAPTRGLPVGDYVRVELVEQLDEEARHLLVHTSVLERVNGELADAVLETEGAAAILERLAADGDLAVAAFDDGNPWYSYHQVLRDLLLVTLRAEGIDQEVKARLRASAWLEAHGDHDLAIGQAVAAGAMDQAADILYRNLWAVLNQGRDRTLERWLAAFDDRRLAEVPELALAAAWRSASFGTQAEVRRWLRIAEAFPPGHLLADGSTVAEGCAAVQVAVVPDGVRAGLAAAELLGRNPTSPWWLLARHTEKVARFLLGELEDPVAGLEEVIDDAPGSPVLAAIASAYQITALVRLGQDERALSRAAVTEELVRRVQLEHYPLAALTHGALAMTAAIRGQLAEVERRSSLASDALRASSASQLRRAVTECCLAEAWVRMDDRALAARHLAAAREALAEFDDAPVLAQWAGTLAGAIERDPAAGDEQPTVALTEAEARVLAELPTHRSLQEIGDRLYVSRNTVKSHTIAIYRKLGVASRSAAVAEASRLGLLPGPR